MREEGGGKREEYCGRAAAVRVGLVAALLFPLPSSLFPQTTPSKQSVILVSIDGFRADYLSALPVANLRALAARGVRADWMQPVVPTVTFPNHYSIVTGLYPAHHGIINNTMVDPADHAWFMLSDTIAVRSSRWWGGEPVWVTAEKQGVRTAAFFWPGTEAEIQGKRPTFWKKYDGAFPNAARVDTVLSWVSRADSARPRLITLYFSIVDHEAHEFGPWAPQARAAALAVDSMVGRLVQGLADRSLTESVNVIVVSDHGLAPTPEIRRVKLDDYLAPARLEIVQLSPFFSANVRDENVAGALAALRKVPHFFVFHRDSTPGSWRYRNNRRIPHIVGVMEEGWELTMAGRRPPRGGNHGYDNGSRSMRALFVAAGPAFRSGALVQPFQNIHVYELVCWVLGIKPAPNDGKLDSVGVMLRK